MPRRLCDVVECGRPHYAKGLCTKHYQSATPRKRIRRGDCEYESCVNPRNGTTYCVQHERILKAEGALRPLAARRWVVDGMKECADCAQILPISEFYNHHLKRSPNSVNPRCKACHSLQNRFKRYGLTRDQVVELLGRPCDACGAEVEPRKRHIDHDHDSGKVRGVLCHHCNLALGGARDSPQVLRALAEYLERAM